VKNIKHQLINDARYRAGIERCLDKPQILIAPTNYCNLACDYCSTKDVRNAKVNMDLDLLKSVVSQSVAQGWGIFFGQTYEPFLHPKIVDIVTFVNEQGVRFDSATNGMAIRENAYGLPMNLLLSFSATKEDYGYRNSSVSYDKYLEKLYRFLKYRIDHNVPGVISVQIADYTIFDGDITYDKKMVDISGIMDKSRIIAEALGLDLEYDEEDWERKVADRTPLPLFVKGETVIRVQPTKIVPNSFDAFVAMDAPLEPKGYCDSCYTMMSIQADGQVAFCCCDPSAHAIAGTITADADLKGFWLGEEMDAVRKGFADFAPIHGFCTKCLANVTENIKPLLTTKNPHAVADILHDLGVEEDQAWFKFPAAR
jgi:MoaA/NifB/PqqE/SkfB family radical SAM enzyme